MKQDCKVMQRAVQLKGTQVESMKTKVDSVMRPHLAAEASMGSCNSFFPHLTCHLLSIYHLPGIVLSSLQEKISNLHSNSEKEMLLLVHFSDGDANAQRINILLRLVSRVWTKHVREQNMSVNKLWAWTNHEPNMYKKAFAFIIKIFKCSFSWTW